MPLATALLVLTNLCPPGAAHIVHNAVGNTEDAKTTRIKSYPPGPKGTEHKELQDISASVPRGLSSTLFPGLAGSSENKIQVFTKPAL